MKLFSILLFFVFSSLNSQIVVVNSYFNAADVRDEWVELIVVGDNVDMRNYSIRDNTAAQTSWQTAVAFQNVSFWNNLRRGTIILLRNRIVNSSGISYQLDTNKADGYIEVTLQTSTLFSGGAFGSSPNWAGSTMDIAATGDVIQLRDGSSNHVHALAHRNTTGTDWNNLPTPKLNHTIASIANNNELRVCPGRTIANFNGASGNTITSVSSTITLGLPNCPQNKLFIDSLRRPDFSSQFVTPSILNDSMVVFNYTGVSNFNPFDTFVGYLILRNTSNNFTHPISGSNYSEGQNIGSALVVKVFKSTDSLQFIDKTVVAGLDYFYRVYAYKFSVDNFNNNNFDFSRGVAYDSVRFVSVFAPVPLLFDNSLKIIQSCKNGSIRLMIHSKFGIDGVTVYSKKVSFIKYNNFIIADVESSTNSILNIKVSYSNQMFDEVELEKINCSNEKEISFFPNPSNGKLFYINKNEISKVEIFNYNGSKIFEIEISEFGEISLDNLTKGIYYIYISELNIWEKIILQ